MEPAPNEAQALGELVRLASTLMVQEGLEEEQWSQSEGTVAEPQGAIYRIHGEKAGNLYPGCCVKTGT